MANRGHFLSLLALFLLKSAISSASVSNCVCVDFRAEGIFKTPDFPTSLGTVDCLFYHFEAPKNHIISITFHLFQLPTRQLGRCSSSVAVFDHSSDGFIDDSDKPDFEFCGKEIAPGKVFFSRQIRKIYHDDTYSKFRHEHLLLSIHSSDAESQGFTGRYEVISKDNFLNTAVEISECSYRVEQTTGKLYSPKFPYYYPSLINCSYIIPHRKGFQIVLISNQMQLSKTSALDVFETNTGTAKELVKSFSSETKNIHLTSSASVFLHFRTGDNQVEKASGFVIEFNYESALVSTRQLDKGVVGDCVITITSEDSKSGTFASDRFNRVGGSNLPTKCRVVFQGYGNEKISVKFNRFNLYVPDNKNISEGCADVDTVSANVRVESRLSQIAEWCGNSLPPQLMSSTNLMQLEYTTKTSRALRDSTRQVMGFEVEYLFHSDWNMQHMNARFEKGKGCRFVFNSTVDTNGKLWSINYPGLYPRNLYCEYIFHGQTEHVVHIHFEYFDVEGYNQCDENTQSDYILFSNYQTHDRTNRRFCGKIAPRGPILSESNYFRMIFSTNDIFDATGFYAHYQFITQPKPQISRVKLTTSSSVHGIASATSLLLSILFYLFSCINS